MSIQEEVQKRKTFAIISHPDAGKTTLTETMLLFGNLIREAGTVKGKKSGKFATSDWMEIEKQRGISVTSSVMNFPYEGYEVNILDTPGHEDFSEDTYRTLTAVDSVVMVIDSTKGIEAQTKKLFKVCRMRGIPIFTFFNKVDREGREPLDLMEEIEEVLEIETYPMNYPAGMGKRFLGTFDRQSNEFVRYLQNGEEERVPYDKLEADEYAELRQREEFQMAQDEVALLDEAGENFSLDSVLAGEQTPVFFGSALAPFGVETFLDSFIEMAPAPGSRQTTDGVIQPTEEEFSGFIFKIQANMNPNHRDRIAFVRICSGKFTRDMSVKLSRTGKTINLNQSQQFVASQRGTIEEAYAGDIIGIYDPNVYHIGDTITESKTLFEFDELPQFPPELYKTVTAKNVMKSKQFYKGIEQLVQEGAIQLFKKYHTESFIIGAVGQLQFDVFQYRMQNEYNSEVMLEDIGERVPRWLRPDQVDESIFDSRSTLVRDRENNPVVLFKNEFSLNLFKDRHPEIELIDLYEVNQYEQS
ncbi:peptide chain release factor 3 [Alkalibacillus almallahensis]|uniref:peptide chain release factor 3 n=1 Tax=Alkalibacillus almallahensis TaxID=1379154 RepID=UPI001422F88E|nr:peptide chain release factor 3 [Alkalibacillus almallahensis]NIK13156.1 peptide chain release factor 3 [Alkalibacillus almallahensis]